MATCQNENIYLSFSFFPFIYTDGQIIFFTSQYNTLNTLTASLYYKIFFIIVILLAIYITLQTAILHIRS